MIKKKQKERSIIKKPKDFWLLTLFAIEAAKILFGSHIGLLPIWFVLLFHVERTANNIDRKSFSVEKCEIFWLKWRGFHNTFYFFNIIGT